MSPAPWIRLHTLRLSALLLAPVAFQAPLGLAPLMAMAALALAACWGAERRMPPIAWPMAAVLGLFALLATVSALWALEPGGSAGRALRFLGESAAGLLLLASLADAGDEGRRRVLAALAAGTAITLVLVAVDVGGDGVLTRALHGPNVWLTDTNRGASILALLVWPVGLWAWRRHGRAGLLLPVAVGLAVVLLRSDSARLALFSGLAVFVLARLSGPLLARLAMMALPAVILAMPLLPLMLPTHQSLIASSWASGLKISGLHRLVIWQFAGNHIVEKPLLGWGFEASRSMPGRDDPVALIPGQPATATALPLHPHNGALQIWLELGALGALLAALFTGLALRPLTLPDLRTPTRAAGLAAAASTAVLALMAFGLFQSWWVAGLWLSLSATAAAVREPAAQA